MRASRLSLAMVAFFLAACVTDRYQYMWGDAYFAPSARRLSRQDLDQITDIISRPFPKIAYGIGSGPYLPKDEINVVTRYGPEETYLYHLKKSEGTWHKLDEGRISVSLSHLPVSY
jgi:hypothetical protein